MIPNAAAIVTKLRHTRSRKLMDLPAAYHVSTADCHPDGQSHLCRDGADTNVGNGPREAVGKRPREAVGKRREATGNVGKHPRETSGNAAPATES